MCTETSTEDLHVQTSEPESQLCYEESVHKIQPLSQYLYIVFFEIQSEFLVLNSRITHFARDTYLIKSSINFCKYEIHYNKLIKSNNTILLIFFSCNIWASSGIETLIFPFINMFQEFCTSILHKRYNFKLLGISRAMELLLLMSNSLYSLFLQFQFSAQFYVIWLGFVSSLRKAGVFL